MLPNWSACHGTNSSSIRPIRVRASTQLSWNVIRAFHLVGRCIDCGECDRVCPVDIPLRLLNVKMIAEVEEAFDYVAGMNAGVEPALVTFSVDDRNDNIR